MFCIIFVKSASMNLFRYIFHSILCFLWSFASTFKDTLFRYFFLLVVSSLHFLGDMNWNHSFSVNKSRRIDPLRYLFHKLYPFCIFMSFVRYLFHRISLFRYLFFTLCINLSCIWSYCKNTPVVRKYIAFCFALLLFQITQY